MTKNEIIWEIESNFPGLLDGSYVRSEDLGDFICDNIASWQLNRYVISTKANKMHYHIKEKSVAAARNWVTNNCDPAIVWTIDCKY